MSYVNFSALGDAPAPCFGNVFGFGDAPAPKKKEQKNEISREFDCMLVPEVFGGGRPAQHVLQARQGGV